MYLRNLILFFCFLCIAHAVHAQLPYDYRQHKKFYNKYYLGAGLCNMGVTIQQHFYTQEPEFYHQIKGAPPEPSYDTNIYMERKSVGSWYFTAGTFCPLIKTGKNGMLAIDVSVNTSFFKYELGKINYSNVSYIEDEHSTSLQESIPLALVIKTGGEVNEDKKDKFLFSCGVGIAPTASISKFAISDLQLNVRKFVTMELGVFAGVAWKVRLSYYTGTMKIVDLTSTEYQRRSYDQGTGYDSKLESKVIGQGCLTASLVFMPFSWNWSRSNGYGYSY